IEIKLKDDLDKNLIVSAAITAVYLLAALFIYIVEVNTRSEYEILRKANQYYDRENYFMAAKYYKEALKMNSDSAKNIYGNYGIALAKLADFDLSIKYLKEAYENDKENFEKLYDLAHTIYLKAVHNSDKEEYLTAAAYFEALIPLNPDKDSPYIWAGMCYRNAGDYEKAVAIYKKAASIKTFNKALFYNLIGDSFADNFKGQESLDYYNSAVAADPSFVLSYINLGDKYRSLKEYGLSIANYKKAIQINPNLTDVYVKIGSLYLDMDKHYDAEQLFLQALKTDPNNASALYYLGTAYRKMGLKKESEEYLKRAVYLGYDKAGDALIEMRIDLR
ncbi:MAG: tetratricopeptide repeat protein, partial [Elusimicrobiota bacterium]|nr:tetratricopeptide repeat protein [Elusimicrobiota bacterium]